MSDSYAWMPSADRTLAAFGGLASPPRGRSAPTPPRVWPAKDSASLLDYTIDCTAWLAPLGDSVAGCAVAGNADLVIVLAARLGQSVVLWLSGGTPGVTYPLIVTLTTASGQSCALAVALPVTGGISFGVPAPPPMLTESGGTLTTEGGAALTIAAGQFAAAAVTEGGVILTTSGGAPLNT